MERRVVIALLMTCGVSHAQPLEVGFGHADITPKLGDRPVFLAGFAHNRRATDVHDRLAVRAVVLKHGSSKIAIASADVIGVFLPAVERVRSRLSRFDFVLVGATHNHHGPDTLGLWGATPLTSGVDKAYMAMLEAKIVEAITAADGATRSAEAFIGSAAAPELLHDSRSPKVLHDELVTVGFRDPAGKPLGALVQWNCHPEAVNSKNTRLTSDFVGPLCDELTKRWACPVVYLSGTVGGLLTPARIQATDEKGVTLPDGSFEKTHDFGRLLAGVADRARTAEKPLRLTPFEVRTRSLLLPVDNKLYRLARQLGVLDRAMHAWSGDPDAPPGEPLTEMKGRPAVRSEISRLRLGELDIAVIPGEIYPELVLGKVQDPPEPNADFPDAPAESSIYGGLTGRYKMIVGLGNDELGYILPKRQWDEKSPYCYGLKKAPYGEINSLGPETGPLVCEAFRRLCK